MRKYSTVLLAIAAMGILYALAKLLDPYSCSWGTPTYELTALAAIVGIALSPWLLHRTWRLRHRMTLGLALGAGVFCFASTIYFGSGLGLCFEYLRNPFGT